MNNLLINFNGYFTTSLLVLAEKTLPLIFGNSHFDSSNSWLNFA
jgi:hypothetical protein